MAPAQWSTWSLIALLTTFAGPRASANAASGASNAASDEDDGSAHDGESDVPLEERPVSLRATRGIKHEDCGHRTPLWEHVVASGEHLGIIAGRYGVRQRDLLELNPQLTNPNLIHPGERVRVCPEIAPRIVRVETHRVASGETLSEIAAARGMSTHAFLEVQETPLSDPHRLRAGQVLAFRVDGGMVEEFLPPLPRPKSRRAKSKRGGSGASSPRARVDVKLDLGDAAHIKRPHLAYGTAKTIRLLTTVVRQYKARHRNGPRVLIGDISRQGGGALSSHLSHRSGHDVDVGYVLRGEAAKGTRFAGVNHENLDLAKTWTLVRAFLQTHEVVYIFMDYGIQERLYDYALHHGTPKSELDEVFQYPRGRGRNHGIIRHWKSHKHHFHVRFR